MKLQGVDAFTILLLCSVMSTKDSYEFFIDYYVILDKMGVVK